jgi:hypothetical protein
MTCFCILFEYVLFFFTSHLVTGIWAVMLARK